MKKEKTKTYDANNLHEIEDDGLPCDMKMEIESAIRSGREAEIEYRAMWESNEQKTHLTYFPEAGRGGLCEGGNTNWTDCSDLKSMLTITDEKWSN